MDKVNGGTYAKEALFTCENKNSFVAEVLSYIQFMWACKKGRWMFGRNGPEPLDLRLH